LAAILASRSHDSAPRPADRPHDTPPPPDTPPPRETPPAPTPAPPRSLDPPHAIEPGTAQAPGPQLDCRRGVTLRWSAVAGARDYVVLLEAQPERRGWTQLRVAPAGMTQVRVSPQQGLAYANRWSVRARGTSDGPP